MGSNVCSCTQIKTHTCKVHRYGAHVNAHRFFNKEKLEGCEEIKPHSKSKLCLFRKNPVTSSIHSLKHFHEGRIAPTDFIWQSILRKKRKHEGEAEFNLYQL